MGSSGRMITSADIVNGTIQGVDIANGTMLDQNFASNSIHGFRIQNYTVSGSQVADATLGGTKIANGTMLDQNFAANSIHGNKLQNGSVASLQVVDASLTNSDLAALTVRGGIDGPGSRIAQQTIYGPNDIYPGGVFNAQIASKTIRGGVDGVAGRIADRSIVASDIAVGTLTSTEVGVGAAGIHGNRLVPGSVSSNEIADGSLVNGDLAAQTLRGGVDGAASRFVQGSINSQDLAASSVSSVTAAASSAAFATSAGGWIFDSAAMPLTITLPVAGWIIVQAVGGFFVSGASYGTGYFGIVRVGAHASPPWFVKSYFHIGLEPLMVAVHHTEFLGAGAHTFYFGMARATGGVWTLNATTDAYRSMIAFGLVR